VTAPPVWPAPPRPGQAVILPVGAPPVLFDALDYRGDDRHVAVYCDPTGTLWLDDGASRDEADQSGWRHYARHPLTQHILAGYDLGGAGRSAAHWLLADRITHQLSVGLPDDTARVLAAQPHTRSKLTGALTPRWEPYPDGHPPANAYTPGGDWRDDVHRTTALHEEIDRFLNHQAVRTLWAEIHALGSHISRRLDTSAPVTATPSAGVFSPQNRRAARLGEPREVPTAAPESIELE
jgi:hypothetical protein